MARRIVSTALLAGAAFIAGGWAALQQAPPPVVSIHYMRAAPGQESEYERLESEVWKPIHEARREAGVMRDWAFYRVQYPQGTEAPYTHVTVNVYDSWADYDVQELERWVRQLYPDRSLDEMTEEANAARDYVRGEIWREVDRLD